MPETIYVLTIDRVCNMHSYYRPTGFAVKSKKEAVKFLDDIKVTGDKSFSEIKIYKNYKSIAKRI